MFVILTESSILNVTFEFNLFELSCHSVIKITLSCTINGIGNIIVGRKCILFNRHRTSLRKRKDYNNVCRNETIFNPQRASQLYWNGKENKYIVCRKKECAKRIITNVLLCMQKDETLYDCWGG